MASSTPFSFPLSGDATWADAVAPESYDVEYESALDDERETQSQLHLAFFEVPEVDPDAAAARAAARQTSRPSSAAGLDVKRMPSVLSGMAMFQERRAVATRPGEPDRATFGGVAGRMTGAGESIETWSDLVRGAPGHALRARSRLRKASKSASAAPTPEPQELPAGADSATGSVADPSTVLPMAPALPAAPRPDVLRRAQLGGRRLRPASAC